MDKVSKLSTDTISNAMIYRRLGLSNIGEWHFDILPTEVLERYLGEYSLSAEASRNQDIPDPFFRKIAKFLLQVVCVHLNAYGMPKQKVGVVISTFQGRGKLQLMIQQCFMVLFPPNTPSAPTSRPLRR